MDCPDPRFAHNIYMYSASSLDIPIFVFFVNHNVFIYKKVSIDTTVLRLGEDVRVSFLGMIV